MSDNDSTLVTEWFKNSSHTEKYVIKISEYREAKYIDARLHFTDDEGKTWKFTKKGVNVSAYNLDALISGLQKAKAMLEGKTEEPVEEKQNEEAEEDDNIPF